MSSLIFADTSFPSSICIFLIQFQHRHEGRLRDFHVADLAHALLPFLLFLQQLTFTGDIATIPLRRYVLAQGTDVLAGDDLRTDGGLDGYFKLLPRQQLFELLAYFLAEVVRIAPVDERRQRIDRLTVQAD